jgi:hypothetical protein
MPEGDAALKPLKPGAHALHGLGALTALEGSLFFAVDNKDPHAGLL